jgi:catechol 2,3-dioxygenase-like lactoylglutathione lyase family enzyme
MSADARTPVSAGTGAQHHAHAVMHCNLNTVDVDRAAAFYMAVLDVEPRMRSVSTDGDSTFMGLGPHTTSVTTFLYDRRGPRAAPALELVGWTDPATEPAAPGTAPATFTGIGFRATDLRVVRARLAAVGAEPAECTARVRGGEWPALRTLDLDGVPLEVVQVPGAPGDPAAGALSHERLRSTDLDATVAWFGALGWTVRARGPADGGAGTGGAWASLVLPEDPTFSLEFTEVPVEPVHGSARRANTQGLYRMALAVEDVAAAHASLVESGVAGEVPEPLFVPMEDTPTGGFTVMFLTGPDGAVVELVSRPRSEVRRPLEPR